MPTDPFTETYDALWTLLEGDTELASAVRLMNRIKLTGTNPKPAKESVQNADLPELMLMPTGGAMDLIATSTSTKIEQVYALRLATADVRVSQAGSIFPAKWEMLKALTNIKRTLMTLSYVTDVRVQEFEETLEDDDANRGAQGWSLTIPIVVEMWWETATLQAG